MEINIDGDIGDNNEESGEKTHELSSTKAPGTFYGDKFNTNVVNSTHHLQ